MTRIRRILIPLCGLLLVGPARSAPRQLTVTVGKSIVIEHPVEVRRVALTDPNLAEAVVIGGRELMLNGKMPGETTLLLWDQQGARESFDLHVEPPATAVDAVRRELAREMAGQDVTIEVENGAVFLRGVVKDLLASDRAAAIAGALGKPVNLLRVAVPPGEPQVLLRVRFANVDRGATSELGASFFGQNGKTTGAITTQQFGAPGLKTANEKDASFNLSDALNILLFRTDLNLGAVIKALQARRLLEILAEPNLLAMSGKPASFLAGGEYPYPVVQGTSGFTSVTIQFKEFGIRLSFTPTVTPRGTLRLQVAPEVSALDFANGLTVQGFTVPGLSVRRVQTEIELEDGQSFAIAGLLDNRVAEVLNKVPGIGDIPILGRLFQSRSLSRNKSELLIIVTPEFVHPIPAGDPLPTIGMPKTFLPGDSPALERSSGKSEQIPRPPARSTMPVEELQRQQGAGDGADVPVAPPTKRVGAAPSK